MRSPSRHAVLIGTDERRRTPWPSHLNDPVHHQNTIYSATVPAAAFVAKILSDPRTGTVVADRNGRVLPLRAALLDWVTSVATEVDSQAEARMARVGLCREKHLEFVQVRALRPGLFQAVSAFFHASDLAVQEAAVAAAIPLLDAPELYGQRAPLTPMVRDVLASSDHRSYRFIASRGLKSWEEETPSLSDGQNEDLWAGGCSSEPPF
jgi:hypothetical protein